MISEKLIIFLTSWIIENTEFDKKLDPPKFFSLTQNEMSDKACYSSNNCKVKAYYIKNDGIYFIDELVPESKMCDQSIILHEMIHHYQKNSKDLLILIKEHLDSSRKTSYLLSKFIPYFSKKKNDNKGPENVLQCEGGSYLDLQYQYKKSTQ